MWRITSSGRGPCTPARLAYATRRTPWMRAASSILYVPIKLLGRAFSHSPSTPVKWMMASMPSAAANKAS